MGYTSAALSLHARGPRRGQWSWSARNAPPTGRPRTPTPTCLPRPRFCVQTDAAEVFVLMHETSSDTRGRGASGHQGPEDAHLPAGRVPERQRAAGGAGRTSRAASSSFQLPQEILRKGHVQHGHGGEGGVASISIPGMSPTAFEKLMASQKGVVFAGTGLGHVSADMVKVLKRTVDRGHPGGDDLPVPARQGQPQRLRHRQGPDHRRGDPGRGHAAGDRATSS